MKQILLMFVMIGLLACGPTVARDESGAMQKPVNFAVETQGAADGRTVGKRAPSDLGQGFVALTGSIAKAREAAFELLPNLLGEAPVPEPLGIRLGEVLPPTYINQHDCRKHKSGFLVCQKPPNVRGALAHSIKQTPDGKVAEVVILFEEFENDNYGLQATKRYDELKSLLTQKWGPAKETNFLRFGALWDEPQYFAKSLSANERVVRLFLGLGTGYPIMMEMKGRDFSSTFIKIVYQHTSSFEVYLSQTQDAEALGL